VTHNRIVALSVVACGGLALASGWALLDPLRLATSIVLAMLMGAVAAEDWMSFRVPNALNALAAGLGFASAAATALATDQEVFWSLLNAAISAMLCGGILLLLREGFYRIRESDGLGMGDVKLGATAGVWLGWQLFAYAVLLASIASLLFVILYVATTGPWQRGRRLPFAVALAPSIWLCWHAFQLMLASE